MDSSKWISFFCELKKLFKFVWKNEMKNEKMKWKPENSPLFWKIKKVLKVYPFGMDKHFCNIHEHPISTRNSSCCYLFFWKIKFLKWKSKIAKWKCNTQPGLQQGASGILPRWEWTFTFAASILKIWKKCENLFRKNFFKK